MSTINPSTSIQHLPNNDDSVLQHLGQLIYSVFSQNKKLPLPLEHKTEVMGFADNANPGRSIKRVDLSKGKSLFSNLVETGEYPTSICRLLSDVIDTGTNGKADSPLKSLDEIIKELEQMSLNPHIFLYDTAGQRYYGQKNEISQLLAISTSMEQSINAVAGSTSLPGAVEVAFVTGVGGVGKSHLVKQVSHFLTSLGCWIAVKTKFERDAERESRQCISFLFDSLVANIVAMRYVGNAADMAYSQRAAQAISDAIDPSSLSKLSGYDLIPGAGGRDPVSAVVELKLWQLTFLLSKLIDAVLSLDRFIMIFFDDLQWCDPVMLTLINEIIFYAGQHSRRCLFVGSYRSNEVTGISPLMTHCNGLKANKNINVTDIHLSSLSKTDVLEMVMMEMKLPSRLAVTLAEAVHKKASGHALFVVKLLNSLVRDGTVAYSPRKHRYDYDPKNLVTMKAWDSVASLIVSNLSSLLSVDLQTLRILCCFGMQSHMKILCLVESCPEVQAMDMSSSLTRLVDAGILEINGAIVTFSHDHTPTSVRKHDDIGATMSPPIHNWRVPWHKGRS